MSDTITITYLDAIKYLSELQVRVPKLSDYTSADNVYFKFISDGLLKLVAEDNLAAYQTDLEDLRNDLTKAVDEINQDKEALAAANLKIDKNITDISTMSTTVSDNKTGLTEVSTLASKNKDASESNSQDINDLTNDKANKDQITALELKVGTNTLNIAKLGWNPQYHEWQTFLTGLDEDGNSNESSDYPIVSEPFNYALNKKYKLLDIDEAGYIMGIKTNLTEERLCFIDKLNTTGDLIRSTQTSDDWVVDVVYDFDTKVTTISVDFLKDTIRDFKLTLMRLPSSITETETTAIKALINDDNDAPTTQLAIMRLLDERGE